MTDDEIHAAFSTHPDHGATVRMVPEADHIAAMRAKYARIAHLEAEVARLTRDHEFEAWSHRCQRERDAAVKRAEKAEAALETACERAAKYHDIITEKREYASGWDAALAAIAARDKAKDDRIAELERATLIETGHVERLRGERDKLRAENARLHEALTLLATRSPRVDISADEFLREFVHPTARAALQSEVSQ